MSIYSDWGFHGNPFEQTRLNADQLGATLLVGRENEMAALSKRLLNPPKLPVLEGANGVGKTSLINVTVFKEFDRFISSGEGPLLVPCVKSFQLQPDSSRDSFCDEVFMEVAQTLLEHGKLIKAKCAGRLAQSESVNRWLNSAVFTNWQGGIPAVSFGSGSQASESFGFERSGFRKTVELWLKEVFPSPAFGAVVCVIDNLELLQRSETARKLLEQLRDPILTIPGLRFVLCGATGITWSLASSPRLEGILHSPQEVSGVPTPLAATILESRRKAFAIDENATFLPVLANDFEKLYEILNKNLRALLHHVDDYCIWVSDRGQPQTDEQKHLAFLKWLGEQCRAIFDAANQNVTKRGWEIFDVAVSLGGAFSPNDYGKFGCASAQALRPFVKMLEEANLLQSWREDTQDKRRKSILVTARGLLVAHHRRELASAKVR